MKKKSGRPQRNDSIVTTVREWVSDNLRYLIIAAAAVIVLLIIIFAVKASNNKKTADTDSTSSKSTAAVTATPVPEQWKNSTKTTITVTPGAQTPADSSNTAAVGYPSLDVPGTVITYLDAVAYGDVDTAAAYSEDLDESTIATIENGHPFSEFNNIYVYEYPGAETGEYVAVTTFDYTERATGNTYPGIGAYYLVTGKDGIIRMASDKTTAENQAAIDEVINLPEVQQIIANVNEAYNAVTGASAGTDSEGAGTDSEAAAEGETPEAEGVPAEETGEDGSYEEGVSEVQPEETGEDIPAEESTEDVQPEGETEEAVETEGEIPTEESGDVF